MKTSQNTQNNWSLLNTSKRRKRLEYEHMEGRKGYEQRTDCLNIIMTTKHHYCDQIKEKVILSHGLCYNRTFFVTCSVQCPWLVTNIKRVPFCYMFCTVYSVQSPPFVTCSVHCPRLIERRGEWYTGVRYNIIRWAWLDWWRYV